MSRTLLCAVLAIAAIVVARPSFGGAPAAGVAVASPAPSSAAPSPVPPRGLAFATRNCAGCHAVEANHLSPNPEAPPFEDIANRPGVSGETLRQFLKDSHNYPAVMAFSIDEAEIAALADHIGAMRKSDYRPLP